MESLAELIAARKKIERKMKEYPSHYVKVFILETEETWSQEWIWFPNLSEDDFKDYLMGLGSSIMIDEQGWTCGELFQNPWADSVWSSHEKAEIEPNWPPCPAWEYWWEMRQDTSNDTIPGRRRLWEVRRPVRKRVGIWGMRPKLKV